MSEKITAKILKKEKEKIEKLMSVFGTTTYNDWLHQQHQTYINENNERALEELLKMREKFSKDEEQDTFTGEHEQEQVREKEKEQATNSNI